MTFCGNGIQESGEQCEIGVLCLSGFWCSTACQCIPLNISSSSQFSSFVSSISSSNSPVCGNGILERGEQCESGIACPAGYRCLDCGCVSDVLCGNGRIDAQYFEECEANADCAAGAYCSGCRCYPPAHPLCGNGLIESPEQCDDSNLVNGDGCNRFCQWEQTGGNAFCGNGITEQGEQCDDSNLVNGDGCSTFCQWEKRLIARCGDGFLDSGEECDDGNFVNGDGCNLHCQWEDLRNCGNRIIEPPQEQCDDGNRQDFDGCSSRCQWEKTIQVAGGEVCGNGIVESWEQCDDGLFNGASGNPCSLNCMFTMLGCTDSTQCLGGYVCADGLCTSCTQNNQCATNLCIMGVCSSCTQNDQCPTRLCQNGTCLPCSADVDCELGQTCRNGSCLPCAVDNQCTTGRCSAGICVPCSSNDQCWTGLCLDGICTVCSSTTQCTPGQICRGGFCIAATQVADAFAGASHAADAMSYYPLSAAEVQGLNPSIVPSKAAPVRRSASVSPLLASLRVFEPWGRTIRVSPNGPAGETGPASVAVMAAGAAAGFAFMRKKRGE